MIHGLEFNDFANLASPWMMLKQNKKVTNIWRTIQQTCARCVLIVYLLEAQGFCRCYQ